MTCKICGRDSVGKGEYCRYHQEALDNLHSSFESWKKASGINWQEYIEIVCKIDETGQWVQEVAEHINSQDGPSIGT